MFKRTIENFTCAHCGAEVEGNGYTDHCPRCLWGKHVDITPGDRKATCGGMMEPVALEGSTPDYRIRYRCTACGREFRVKISADDDSGALVALASKVV